VSEVLAAKNWKTNGHLIADVAKLGYLRQDWLTLDPTYGEGTWWKVWHPNILICHDRYRLDGVDFRNLPYSDKHFGAVAFDPPYKLNGTPTPTVDLRYGVDKPMRWQDKMEMIKDGITECARVTSNILLIKCQDQVCSGKVRWQTDEFTERAREAGLTKIDRFDYYGGYRRQPDDTRQVHARGRGSTLLVFRRVGS
jgi:hypothetical protein